MLQEFEEARQETSGGRMYLLALYYFMSGNLSIVVALVGILWLALASVVIPQFVMPQFGESSVESLQIVTGMIGVWGVTLVLLGTISYLFFFLMEKYAQLVSE